MKELSIEEKAKAYDEVLNRAKKELNTCGSQDCDAARQIFRFFPELKESEDEKIRKEIIEHIKWSYDEQECADEEMHRWISWLEKQGEHANFLNKIQIGDKVTRNRDGVLVNLSQLKRVAKPEQKDVDYNPFDDFRKSDSEINPSEFDARLNALLKKFESLPKKELESSLAFYLNVIQNDGTYKEQKPAWSEEDEKILKAIHNSVDVECLSKNGLDYVVMVDWFDSLKDRVLPKQGRSKNDEGKGFSDD